MTGPRRGARAAAKAAKRGRAADRFEFQQRLQGDVDHGALSAALGAHMEMAPQAFPAANADVWVPIGPTVTRRAQAMSRPRASGRIRDVAVSPDGQRAYAASAKGGLWYSDDAGSTWAPVGGWAGRSVNPVGNGNMFSCGSLLVSFGAIAGTDVVLLGTGEPTPALTETGSSAQGGVGVLSSLGPVFNPVASDPWEPDTGLSVLGGLGVRRLARHPSATPFSNAGADQDRVLAATTSGLFLGTRSHLPAVVGGPPPGPMQPPVVAQVARDGYAWASCAAAPGVDVTDVVWLANGANNRIVYAVQWVGVFFSDDSGATSTPIAALQAPAVAFNNRISMARIPGTSRIYVLAEVNVGGVPTPSVWQITDVNATPQGVAAVPGGVPPDLFGDPTTPPTQAWYDHGFAVEVVGANDRVYLGGSTVQPRTDAEGEWSASLWCFETPSPPAAIAALTAPPTISFHGNPPAGSGADRDGLIGNNVHADVHSIFLTGPAAPTRHVWVGCDGGVYVSEHSGRVNTFAARNAGLATLEPIFIGQHPSSSHYVAAGFQDNGTQARTGDTMWEEIFVGDGGGTAFHPLRSDIIVSQYTSGRWNGTPASDYSDPLTRHAGNAWGENREGPLSAFYSGAATIADTAATARLALGTNRVWLTDNLGAGLPQRWRTLPYPNGNERDTRPSGNDPAVQQAFGVPGFVNPLWVDGAGNSTADNVIDMAWQTGTDLLVIFRDGLVRFTNTNKAAGTWTSTTFRLGVAPVPLAASTVLTSVATVPGTLEFYVGTLGNATTPAIETVWHVDAAGNFTATGLRRALDFTGPPIVAGPCDPCFALVVDPGNVANVYAGTATGVWRGVRTAPATWAWTPYMNGLPQATVQDLRVWQDPAAAAGTPRLLRAAMQSRGVWEVDLANPGVRRTYVRIHPRDDRRILPTPMANPRRRPTAAAEPVSASPDIVVRPAWPLAAPPVFHSTIQLGNLPVYDIWTFQTAFRWLYPSCVADGQWSDAMRDLVRIHRQVLTLSAGATIDQTLWRHVVGGTVGGVQRGVRLLPDPIFADKATVSTNVADSLAVYRAPWQTTLNFSGAATEVDVLETVLPVRTSGDEWTVFREPSTVDILLHHRDSRIVQSPGAFAVLLWRFAPTAATLLGTAIADLKPFYDGVVAAGNGGAAPASPAGWNVATTLGGSAMRTLTKSLDARLPRAVSIDVDLTVVPEGNRVLLLAMVGSTADDPVTAPVNIPPANNPPANLSEFVRAWPNAAMRIVRVTRRI